MDKRGQFSIMISILFEVYLFFLEIDVAFGIFTKNGITNLDSVKGWVREWIKKKQEDDCVGKYVIYLTSWSYLTIMTKDDELNFKNLL